MIDSVQESTSKHGDNNRDRNPVLQEYNEMVETFKKDLTVCKTEQKQIRSTLESIQNDSKDIGDFVKDQFSRIHMETCNLESIHNKEMIMNLQERITVLQAEKDSAFQLWQIALKAIDALEEELKSFRTNGKSSKLYEEQVNNVKKTYSEAIKALESKLLQARENFLKQQASWETNRDKIDELLREKADVTRRYEVFQKDCLEKDRNNAQLIEAIKIELVAAKADTQNAMHVRSELESKLNEAVKFTASLIAKNEETKCKMSEALELVDAAVREKDLILQREARVLEEKNRLEIRLSRVTEEHTGMLQEEIIKIKDGHERSTKQYIFEIKKLKADLKQKTALLENAEKECKLAQEELEKISKNSEDLLQKSRMKIVDFEQKLEYVGHRLQDNDDAHRRKYNTEIKHLENKVMELGKKLNAANDKLRKTQQQNCDTAEDQVKQANEKTKDMIEQYNNLEKRLARSLEDRENLLTEIKNLQSAFDREMQKREYEKHLLENKIHDLELSVQRATLVTHDMPYTNLLAARVHATERKVKKPSLDITVDNKEHCCRLVLLEQMNKAQEKFDKKIKELSHHVEVHQKLSKKWKEEVKSITTKFQEKSKEHRAKINVLRKENNELNEALLECQQQLSKHKIQDVPRWSEENEEVT